MSDILTGPAEGALAGEGVAGGVDAHGDGALLVAALLALEAGGEGAAHRVRQPLAAVARRQEPVAHPPPRRAVAADVAAIDFTTRLLLPTLTLGMPEEAFKYT